MLGRPNTTNAGVFPAPINILNDAATHTIAAVEGQTWVLDFVSSSYLTNSGTPTFSGSLTVTIGGVIVLKDDYASAGLWHKTFEKGVYKNSNEALVVTLSAGGTNVIGTLSIGYH